MASDSPSSSHIVYTMLEKEPKPQQKHARPHRLKAKATCNGNKATSPKGGDGGDPRRGCQHVHVHAHIHLHIRIHFITLDLHHATLHYIALASTYLHEVALPYIALHCIVHCVACVRTCMQTQGAGIQIQMDIQTDNLKDGQMDGRTNRHTHKHIDIYMDIT